MADNSQRLIGNRSVEIGQCGSIYLRNFKAFGPNGQNIPLSRINLLFGPNSSGKSSVFQAIHLALQTHLGMGTHGRHVNPLRYRQVVNKGRLDQSVQICLTLMEPGRPIENAPSLNFTLGPTADDRFRIRSTGVITNDNLEFIIDHGNVDVQDADSDVIRTGFVGGFSRNASAFNASVKSACPEIDQEVTLEDLDLLNSVLTNSPLRIRTYHHGRSIALRQETGTSNDAIIEIARRVINESLSGKPMGLDYFGINVLHLGPIRHIPSRDDLIARFHTKSGFESDVEGTAWRRLLLGHQPYSKELNVFIGEHFVDLGYQMKTRAVDESPDAARYLVLEETRGLLMEDVELDLTDVGVGISQVIPVIGAVCMHSGLLMFIEQPELHLHPRAQCGLADVFIATVTGSLRRQNHLFLETHSEHIVLRMLRRIRETTRGAAIPDYLRLTPEDISILYFEPTPMGTIVHKMEVTPDGDFANRWPNGFFPERARELFDD